MDGWEEEIFPGGDYGQITLNLPRGGHEVRLEFTDTPIRRISNVISLASVLLMILIVFVGRLWSSEFKKMRHFKTS